MLSENILKIMADKAAETMLLDGSVKGIDRPALSQVIQRALAAEMNVEQELMREAEKLLAAHMSAARSSGADVGELRAKILHKLARDKGVVLK